MGEVKIYVSSVAVPLMGRIGDRRAEVVAYSVLSNTSLVGNLINESIGGMGIKARYIYNYARDYYALGLPTSNNEDTYMPIVPLRHDNVDLTTIDDDLYRTSKTLLRKMNLRIDDLAEYINENPDVDKIDHAWVMFGVSANTEDIPSLRYLNNYFHYLYGVQEYNKEIFDAAIEAGTLPPYTLFRWDRFNPTGGGSFEGGTSLKEHGLDIDISFHYITSTTYSGHIGKIGFTTKELVYDWEEYDTGEINDSHEPIMAIRDISTITYRLQISKTHIRKVSVCGLKHKNYVYKNKVIITSLRDYEEDDENSNLVIPIHYDIANQLPLLDRNDLYTNSLHLIINAIEKVKVKWYASKAFRVVMMFVSVVLIYFGAPAINAAIQGAIEAGKIALMWAFIEAVAIAIALNIAFKYVVEMIGPEAGIIIAVIIIIATLAGYHFSSIKFGTGLIPTAQQFLMAGQALLNASNNYVKGQLTDLYEESEEFSEEVKEKIEILETAWDELDMAQHYDPLNFVKKQTQIEVPHESPDAFYNRTIHTGNIGVLTLDVISVYHSIMLRLPDAEYV